jgi:nucleoside-diphosphate-sugar epimerase
MQFNIFANLFVLNACQTKMIKVFGGDKWRPLLHVRDAANAFLAVGEAPLTKISGQIFNVGNNRENYTIQRVAEIVAEEISGTEVAVEPTLGSNSSYKVQFGKIQDTLGFKPLYDLRKGVCELRDRILDGTYDGILLNR